MPIILQGKQWQWPPDHLLMSSYTNPSGHNVGVQTTSTSYYGQVDPLVITDGYYIEVP